MKMFTNKSFVLSCVSLVLLGVSGVTKASTVYEFNSTAVGAFGDGPYGTVTLTQNVDDVDVTVLLRDDLNFVNTGNENSHTIFSFNSDLIGLAVTDISFDGINNLNYELVSPGGNSPFGEFDYAIFCSGNECENGAPGQSADPLSFTVLNASVADLVGLSTVGNPDAYFAADVICISGDCTGATGGIGVVPVPASVWLFGSGLIGLVGVARRRQS